MQGANTMGDPPGSKPPVAAGSGPSPVSGEGAGSTPLLAEEVRPRVLVLEDNRDDAFFMLRELERFGYQPEWHCVQTKAEFLDQLAQAPDIILSDCTSAAFSGADALAAVRSHQLDIPLIMVSGTENTEKVVTALRAGISDYVPKDELGRLGLAVQQALQRRRRRGHPVVYVVDAGPDRGAGLAFCLQMAGYPVKVFPEPELVAPALAGAIRPPSLLITDTNQPAALVMAFVSTCRQLAPNLKVIAVRRGSALGVFPEGAGQPMEVLHKPFTYHELLEAVHRLLPAQRVPSRPH